MKYVVIWKIAEGVPGVMPGWHKQEYPADREQTAIEHWQRLLSGPLKLMSLSLEVEFPNDKPT